MFCQGTGTPVEMIEDRRSISGCFLKNHPHAGDPAGQPQQYRNYTPWSYLPLLFAGGYREGAKTNGIFWTATQSCLGAQSRKFYQATPIEMNGEGPALTRFLSSATGPMRVNWIDCTVMMSPSVSHYWTAFLWEAAASRRLTPMNAIVGPWLEQGCQT